jgi:hypothetical protein
MKRVIAFVAVSGVSLLLLSVGAVFSSSDLHLVTYQEFLAAWNAGQIQRVTSWNNGFESHYPGMSNQLRVPNLAVKEEIPQCPGEAGVGMAWGSTSDSGQEIIAAWQYEFGLDPDLTGKCIHLCVFPPCFINTISLGMKDVNGKIKSWDWTVGAGGVPCSTQVCFTLGLSGGAGQAGATSFYQDPGFDIHNVVSLIFDENGVWVDSVLVDPFGFNQRVWNYWKDIYFTEMTPAEPSTWGKIKSFFIR